MNENTQNEEGIMKKIGLCILASALLMVGCAQDMAKNMGGSTTIYLEPNQKLEEITWKDDSDLWYLTRPMRDDDIAETHVFTQSKDFGLFEGNVTIIETKGD